MAGGSGGGPLAEAPLVIPLGRGCAGLDMYVSLMSKGENFCNSEIRPFAEAPLVIPPGRTWVRGEISISAILVKLKLTLTQQQCMCYCLGVLA